jgi:hypothetical protein
VAGACGWPGIVAATTCRATSGAISGRCLCLFEGTSGDQIRALNDTAGLPYERVVEALDLTP